MLQASILDCLFLDRFPFSENVIGTPEVDVRGSDVVQALVIAVIVVVIDKDTPRASNRSQLNLHITRRKSENKLTASPPSG